jgi:hypothetical protein
MDEPQDVFSGSAIVLDAREEFNARFGKSFAFDRTRSESWF